MSEGAPWWQAARDRVQHAARQALIGQAAQALAQYLTDQAITPDQLAQLVDSGQNWVLAALAQLPPQDIGRARWAFGAAAARLTEQDFWEILKHDALHRAHHAHALVLATPDRWPRVLGCFRAAQAWLSGSAAAAGPPPVSSG